MTTVALNQVAKTPLGEIIERVCASGEALLVTGPDGGLVRLTPVPKPVGEFNGRPMYAVDDFQHLDFPYWDAPKPKE